MCYHVDLPRPRRRLTELIKKMASDSKVDETGRSWHLQFLSTPQEILTKSDCVTSIRCAKNRLEVRTYLIEHVMVMAYCIYVYGSKGPDMQMVHEKLLFCSRI